MKNFETGVEVIGKFSFAVGVVIVVNDVLVVVGDLDFMITDDVAVVLTGFGFGTNVTVTDVESEVGIDVVLTSGNVDDVVVIVVPDGRLADIEGVVEVTSRVLLLLGVSVLVFTRKKSIFVTEIYNIIT